MKPETFQMLEDMLEHAKNNYEREDEVLDQVRDLYTNAVQRTEKAKEKYEAIKADVERLKGLLK